MEGRDKILETYPKSEEITAFLPNFQAFADFINEYCDYVEQNCHVLVTSIYNLNLACQPI